MKVIINILIFVLLIVSVVLSIVSTKSFLKSKELSVKVEEMQNEISDLREANENLNSKFVDLVKEIARMSEFKSQANIIEEIAVDNSISWIIKDKNKSVYGPYLFDDTLLFVAGDGSYKVIDDKGNIRKDGTISGSVASRPIYNNKKIYYINIAGILSCYDFGAKKKKWEAKAGIPTKTTLSEVNDFIVVSTSDKQNTLIHKTTGIVVSKENLGNWIYPPFSIDDMFYFFTGDKVKSFKVENGFVFNNEIEHGFKNIKNIYLFKDLGLLDTDAGQFVFKNNTFNRLNIKVGEIYAFNNELFIKGGNILYKLVDKGSIKKLSDIEGIVFMNGSLIVTKDRNKYSIKRGDFETEVKTKENVINIIRKDNLVILITESNTIYGRGLN